MPYAPEEDPVRAGEGLGDVVWLPDGRSVGGRGLSELVFEEAPVCQYGF